MTPNCRKSRHENDAGTVFRDIKIGVLATIKTKVEDVSKTLQYMPANRVYTTIFFEIFIEILTKDVNIIYNDNVVIDTL